VGLIWFGLLMERVPFDPGRGTITRFVFVDPDFDPRGPVDVTLQTSIDGDDASQLSETVSFSGPGTYRRLKLNVDRIGRILGLRWMASISGGTVDELVDELGNNIVDASDNQIVGPASQYRGFRLLGQTFGFQRLGSFRR
jgi:hypothetical protein